MNIPIQSLLILLLNKEFYNQYKEDIDLNNIKEVYRELSYLYQTLISLHEQHDKDITLDELSLAFHTKYPDADANIYGALFKTLSSIEISPEVGQGVLADVRRRNAALKLSEQAYKVANGTADPSTLQDVYESVSNVKDDHKGGPPIRLVTTNIEELAHAFYAPQGLRWRLNCLNKSLGGLRKGDFGFVFARPETGKTTFLASEITNMLAQAERPVVWFNNEEQGYKVMFRVYQAFFGITSDQLLSNLRRYREEFERRTKGLFRLYDEATISKTDVEKVIAYDDPELVIYDQLTKIKGFKADRTDLMLGDIFQWARELAKNRHAAIGVSQADGTAEGVRYLTMEHVANAKTAVQAEADFILGIGKTHDDTYKDIRFLSISKNKLLGDEDSITDLRHGKFDVGIEASIARYRDIISI